MQGKKLEFERKAISVNEEYFNKLRIYLKFDVSTSLSKAIVIESCGFYEILGVMKRDCR